jgi:putative transposase
LDGVIKFATVSKKAGKYFVAITVDKQITELSKVDKVIGLDLNVKDIVDDRGNKYLNPHPMRTLEDRLRKAHKKVSRKVKGSNGRKKACEQLARVYQKIKNIREDWLHKLSKRIINENQVICVESLSVKDMVKKVEATDENPRWRQKILHRNVLDCGFFSFVQKLTYKALWYGRTLLKVSRWFPSSQLCNHCNYQNTDLEPHQREWGCINCFNNNDRDVNAARNVKDDCLRTAGNAGIAIRPVVRPGLCSG